jgi:acyl-CoA synthetase (NDP forming)
VVRNLVAAGFAGPVYPINPHAKTLAGLRAHASVEEVPGPVELAVIAVGAPLVVDAARACARKGVRALVVLSAGFGEAGPEGEARQAELLQVCRETGMRLVGPNCLGVLNTAIGLNATFSPGRPPAGRIAFASQSGAYGIAALELAARRGLGLSSFVSMGDKADLSGNDFLRFWERDPGTDAVLLYLESLGNPQRFGRIARGLTASKPVIAVKSGRGDGGAARGVVAHRRAAAGLGGHRRRALRPRRRRPRRDARRAARRRRAPRAPAAALGQPGRDRHQRRRPRDLVRRRLRGRWTARRAAA